MNSKFHETVKLVLWILNFMERWNWFDEFSASWNGEIKLDELFSLWNGEIKLDELLRFMKRWN